MTSQKRKRPGAFRLRTRRKGDAALKNKLLKKTDKILSVLILLFGIAYLYAGRNLNFGSFASPKTGFLPRISSIAMIALSIVNIVLEARKPDEVPEEFVQVNWLKAFLYIGTCAVYVLMMEMGLGYLIATPICLLAMIKFTGIKGWTVPILTTAIVTAFFYGVFNVVMGVYLPRFTLF